MTIEEFADQRPHLGAASGPEPSVWEIVVHYYTSHHIPRETAEKYADAYIRQLHFPQR